jgi:hypothetical protein
MRRAFWVCGAVALAYGLSPDRVMAQGAAQAQIVVPTFSNFSMGTTISVPDRGGMYMGGDHRASDFRTEVGPGFGRGLASRRTAADASTRVWIHDFDEMEQSLARGRLGTVERPAPGFASRMHEYATLTRERREEPKETPATKAESEAAFKLAHAADLLKRGQDAEGRGKLKVAALYYKSVVSLGDADSAPVARQRLVSLETKLAGM